jgi:hypothetical protein
MKRSDSANLSAIAAACRKTIPCTLLIACMASMPTIAQQAPPGTVPDNIAPHAAPAQPLPFSHKTHIASGLPCQMCHTNPDPGTQMTFPATETCMSCHAVLATDKPAIKRLQEFSQSGQEIPWVRVYAITAGVTWSHRAHLDANTECETCHGDISQTDAVAETKAIRSMATCISCHQARKVAADCVSCHAWPEDRILGSE